MTTLPEIVDPDFDIELATITRMVDGIVAGGLELLPGFDFQVPPQLGGFGAAELAKPLKASGAEPPLRIFCFAHCAPQKVT